MNAMLVLVGLGVASVIVAIAASFHRGEKALGAVSHQWISEHKLGRTHD